MAERRMFSKQVIHTDAFLDMPLSAQALYFHLSMESDDDGFLASARKIKGMIGASDDDLRLLIAKQFLISFPEGVIAVRHWRQNNKLRKDRYTATVYQDEMSMLDIKESGMYTLKESVGIPSDNQTEPQMLLDGNQTETQISREKESVAKDNKSNARMHEAEELYERVWKLYPVKRGKGQVSDTAKLRLLDIGYEELKRAIQRYKTELDKDEWRQAQNGSTFFNKGYIDYLDKNWQGGEAVGSESASTHKLW